MEKTPVPAHLVPWLNALDETAAQLERNIAMHSLVFYAVVYAAIALWLWLNGYETWWYIVAAVAVAVLKIATDMYNRRNAVPEDMEPDQATIDRLRRFTIAKRIVGGKITGNELWRQSGRLFSWILAPIDNPVPLDVISRVSYSLEWYLNEPGPHLRRSWSVIKIFALMPVAMFVLVLRIVMHGSDELSPFILPLFIIPIVALMRLNMHYAYVRVAIQLLRFEIRHLAGK